MSDNQYALTRRVPAAAHTVLVSPALLESVQQEDPTPEGDVNTWLHADGFDCRCVACEDLDSTGDITFPKKPTDWGVGKDHWFCTDVGQKEWRSHQLHAKWVQACLMFLGHPGKEEVELSTAAVAQFVADQGLSF